MACNLAFEKVAERQNGQVIQAVKSERKGEYLSAEMKEHFLTSGIDKQCTAAFSPHRNRVGEGLNYTLLELVRSMRRH